jgi:two-component system response regulator DevR
VSTSRQDRVVLLDSHVIFRKGVRFVLDEHEGVSVVGEADGIDAGLELIESTEPNVAVVGIREHERSALEKLRSLRSSRPSMHLLVLTRTDSDETLSAAIQAGASGYASKDIDAAELVTAVESVARGVNSIDPVRALRLMRAAQTPAELPEDPLRTLTNQERRILALLAEGMSNREIAENLFLVEKTVRNHVTRVLAKLGVERRTQAALIAAKLATHQQRRG